MTKEETEVKTLESIRDEIWEEMLRLEDKRIDQWADIKYQTLREVLQKLGHLDEPEVLSQEWIDEHAKAVTYDGIPDQTEIVYVDDLQNLLVPKQEVNLKIQELIEKYEQEDGEHSNPENAWIDDFISDLESVLKKEQKYYVLDSEDIPLLERANNQTCKTTTGLSIYEDGRDNSRFELTEQEIKDYDKRYMTFAKPVEELEK